VAQSVRQRVAALPEEARELLGIAAVVGRVVPRALLASIATRPEHALVAAVDAACRARLLEEQGAASYRFAHDVIREVVEQDLGAARRAIVHRRVATVLESATGDLPLERLAFHFVQADVADKAAYYLEKAGNAARARYANAAAEVAYQEAGDLLEGLSRFTEAARVREKWGAVLRTMGRHGAALAAFEQAIAAYEGAGDLESVARTLAETWLLYIERGAAEEGVRRYQTVVDLLAPRGPSPSLAALYAAQSVLVAIGDRYDAQLLIADRAVEMARGAGDDELLAEAINKRGYALVHMVGRVEEAIQAIGESIRLGEAAGGMTNLAGWYNILASTYLERGEVATSRRAVVRGRAIAERQGNLLRLLFNTVTRARLGVCSGDWEQAHADYAWIIETSRQIEASRPLLEALVGLGGLFLARGEWEAATSALEEALAVATQTKNASAFRAANLLLAERDILAGRPEAACARLIALRERSDPQGRNIDDLPVWLAWAKAELGELGDAGTLIAQAITAIRADHRQLALTGALYVHVLVALKQERWREAERALEEGLAVARDIGHPFAEARLLYLRGSSYLHSRDHEKAREWLESARAIFQQLGARWEAVRVEEAHAVLQSGPGCAERAAPVAVCPDLHHPVTGEGRGGSRLSRPDRQAWALEHLRTTGPLSPRAYAKALTVSVDTALLDLRALVDAGLVRAEGTTRDRRYGLAGERRP
jgi:tetratricopeptide (TPR) repeat protein